MLAVQMQIAPPAGEAEETPTSRVAAAQQSTRPDAGTVASRRGSTGMQSDHRAAAATPPIRAELLEAFGSLGKAQPAASSAAGSTTGAGQHREMPGQHGAAAGQGSCPYKEQEAGWPAAGMNPGAAALGRGSLVRSSLAGSCIRPDLLEVFGSSSKEPAAVITPEDAPATLAPDDLSSTCRRSAVSSYGEGLGLPINRAAAAESAESAEQAESSAQPADAMTGSEGGAAGTQSDAAQRTPVSVHSSWASVATTVPVTQLHGAHDARGTPLGQALPGLALMSLLRANSPAAAQPELAEATAAAEPAVRQPSVWEAAGQGAVGQEGASFELAVEEQAAGVHTGTTARVEAFLDRLFEGVTANLSAAGAVPPAGAPAAAAADTGSAAAQAEPEAAQRSLKRLASKVRNAVSL